MLVSAAFSVSSRSVVTTSLRTASQQYVDIEVQWLWQSNRSRGFNSRIRDLIWDFRLKIGIEIWDFGLEIALYIAKDLRFCIWIICSTCIHSRSLETDCIPYVKPVMIQSTGLSLPRLQHSPDEMKNSHWFHFLVSGSCLHTYASVTKQHMPNLVLVAADDMTAESNASLYEVTRLQADCLQNSSVPKARIQGGAKKRGHPISLQIFWKLYDRIA